MLLLLAVILIVVNMWIKVAIPVTLFTVMFIGVAQQAHSSRRFPLLIWFSFRIAINVNVTTTVTLCNQCTYLHTSVRYLHGLYMFVYKNCIRVQKHACSMKNTFSAYCNFLQWTNNFPDCRISRNGATEEKRVPSGNASAELWRFPCCFF